MSTTTERVRGQILAALADGPRRPVDIWRTENISPPTGRRVSQQMVNEGTICRRGQTVSTYIYLPEHAAMLTAEQQRVLDALAEHHTKTALSAALGCGFDLVTTILQQLVDLGLVAKATVAGRAAYVLSGQEPPPAAPARPRPAAPKPTATAKPKANARSVARRTATSAPPQPKAPADAREQRRARWTTRDHDATVLSQVTRGHGTLDGIIARIDGTLTRSEVTDALTRLQATGRVYRRGDRYHVHNASGNRAARISRATEHAYDAGVRRLALADRVEVALRHGARTPLQIARKLDISRDDATEAIDLLVRHGRARADGRGYAAKPRRRAVMHTEGTKTPIAVPATRKLVAG